MLPPNTKQYRWNREEVNYYTTAAFVKIHQHSETAKILFKWPNRQLKTHCQIPKGDYKHGDEDTFSLGLPDQHQWRVLQRAFTLLTHRQLCGIQCLLPQLPRRPCRRDQGDEPPMQPRPCSCSAPLSMGCAGAGDTKAFWGSRAAAR